jgi:hypothetical protein
MIQSWIPSTNQPPPPPQKKKHCLLAFLFEGTFSTDDTALTHSASLGAL